MSVSTAVSLKTNLADNPVTMAMKDGRVASDIVTLDYRGPKAAHDGFKPMVRENAFDAGELAIVTYLQARAWGKPYVMLPAPVVARFQHHCVGFNHELGHLSPKDIEGRKVGVRTYAQTTALWVRGILQDEYGVDLNKVTWLTVDEGHLTEYQDPPNCQRLPPGSNLPQMMLNGEVAAAILGNEMPNDPRVRTLVPDAMAAAKAWYRRTGVIPINHIFVVREELSRERPDVVREIFRMLVESRKLAPESATSTLPPLGFHQNRKGLDMAIQWSYDQKLIPRRLSVDELFDETTASLEV